MTSDSTPAAGDRREFYLDRRVCSVTPDRIDIRPARSIIFLPILTLLLGLTAFPVIFFWGNSLSVELRLLLTIGAVIVVPMSGVGLVYSIAGAHIVIERAKQSVVLQQGYLGMGVGTQDLIPFWKIDRVEIEELTPHDYRRHQEDFAQYEISILKLSGKRISVGMVTVIRADAAAGLERAKDVATAVAEISGAEMEIQTASKEPSVIECAAADETND